jgi:hypothetical protein
VAGKGDAPVKGRTPSLTGKGKATLWDSVGPNQKRDRHAVMPVPGMTEKVPAFSGLAGSPENQEREVDTNATASNSRSSNPNTR